MMHLEKEIWQSWVKIPIYLTKFPKSSSWLYFGTYFPEHRLKPSPLLKLRSWECEKYRVLTIISCRFLLLLAVILTTSLLQREAESTSSLLPLKTGFLYVAMWAKTRKV